jgi:putative ABC transport system permease protein
MLMLRLAVKNLTRAKRRSVLASAAVVVGVFYLIVGQSVIGGIEESIVSGVIDGLTSHVTIRPEGYPSDGLDHPIDTLLPDDPVLEKWLTKESVAWTKRIIFNATLHAEAESLRLRVIGYDPNKDGAVFSRATWKSEPPLESMNSGEIFLVAKLAKLLHVEVGSEVTLQARTPQGALNAMAVKIGSVGTTGNILFDQSGLFMPAALSQRLLRSSAPSHISLRLSDRQAASDLKARLNRQGRGRFEAIDWLDEAKDLLSMQRIRRIALNVLVGMLFLMSSMAIANTVLMAAHERVREVGTLRAMGLSRQGVLKLFLAEGALLGIVAGTLGTIAGGACAWYLSINPIDLNELKADSIGSNVQLSSYIYGRFSASLMFWPLVISFIVALLASVYPARVASLMEPADAIRAP